MRTETRRGARGVSRALVHEHERGTAPRPRILSPFLAGVFLACGPGFLFAQEPGTPVGESLTLSRAVSMALETHPVMGQARAMEDAAAARVRQTRSARLPSMAAQGSLQRHQEPMVVAPLHGFDPMEPPSFDRSLVQGAVSVGYTLFDGGARGARIQKAEAGERAVEAGSEEAGMALVAQVSAAYLGILSEQELMDAVLGQKEALEAELDRVRLFLEEGKAARVDLLRVEAALQSVRAREISVRSNLDLARGRLARLTGLEPEAVRRMPLTPLAPGDAPAPALEASTAAALDANPELDRVRKELSVARAGVREATAAWFPRVEANGRYSNFGTLDGGHVQEWQGSLQVSYPLFTGGARKGERERARAEARGAAEALRLAEMEVEDRVEESLAQVRETGALREALELAARQSAEVARIEALALEAGAGVQTDFLRAQAELFHAQASLVQARHGEILARIQLARVQGELSLQWIQENMEMDR
ncbi:MAG: TolC family protein [Gemmatimonadota bacterium]